MTPAALKRAGKAFNKSLTTIASALLAEPGKAYPQSDYMVYAGDFKAYGPARNKFGCAVMDRVIVLATDNGPEPFASNGHVLFGPIEGDTTGRDIKTMLESVLPTKNLAEIQITGRVQRGTDPSDDGPVPVYGNYTLSTGWEMNPVYLAAAWAFLDCERGLELRQEAGNPQGPIVIQGSAKLALVMPIRTD
jgi:hypothetical protein